MTLKGEKVEEKKKNKPQFYNSVFFVENNI